MPSAKTECTELCVASGLLNLDHLSTDYDSVESLFGGTLTEEKFERFKRELSRGREFYQPFYDVGYRLRRDFRPLSNVSEIQWTGPLQQAATSSVPQDLFAANMPISVKADSNVVANLSPYNLLDSLPSGSASAAREVTWFLHTSSMRLQAYYA